MPNYLEKEWTALPPARVRGANLYSLRVCTRWRSLKPCARLGERSILREAPQGRSDKMWSESTFAPNAAPEPSRRPQCSAPRARPARLKIAAADAAGSPYFHAGWSRRAAGSTTGKRRGRARSSFPAARQCVMHFDLARPFCISQPRWQGPPPTPAFWHRPTMEHRQRRQWRAARSRALASAPHRSAC